MSIISNTNNANPAVWQGPKAGNKLGDMGSGDFLKLMTAQLQMQDPMEPTDNSQMLAQMAQFTSLANTTKTNESLDDIAAKLDVLIAQQTSSNSL